MLTLTLSYGGTRLLNRMFEFTWGHLDQCSSVSTGVSETRHAFFFCLRSCLSPRIPQLRLAQWLRICSPQRLKAIDAHTATTEINK